jgi:tyrosine-protein kinase Etk/Wzc
MESRDQPAVAVDQHHQHRRQHYDELMTGVPKEIHMYQPTPDIEEDEINLGDLVGVLIENRWLIILITLAALFLGAFHAFTAMPIYKADGMLQVEEKSSGLANLDVSTMLEDRSPVAAEIEILRSRKVLGAVVDNLQLDIGVWPEYSPLIGEALARRMPADERPLAKVDTLDVPDSWRGRSMQLVVTGANRYELRDAEGEFLLRGTVGEVASLSLPGDEKLTLFVAALQGDEDQVFWIQRSARIDSIKALQGSFGVSERGDWSGILGISVEGGDPASITAQVNEIANVYVRQNVERKSAEAQSTLEFLDEQLPLVRQNMEAAELSLNSYRLEKGSIDLPLETQSVLQTIVSVEGQLNELRAEREKVTLAFTIEHPTIIALDRQIGQLNQQLNELNEQVRDLPSTQQELVRLIRDVEVNTVLYTSLLDTAQELRVVKAGTIGNVRIIDHAVTPTYPIKPSKFRILLLSILLGGFVGVAVAFARKALHAGVEDPDLIEKHINVPVYATVVHSKQQAYIYKALQSKEKRRAILAVDSPNDSAIESLRNLRTALHFGMMNVKNNCIMIAGPSPSVGKSFVSVNLAAVLASNDKKVLLIDGDLRKGHLHKYLGLPRSNGLSEFISGEIPIGKALHQTTIPGLTLVPTGELPPNPAELLLHQRFANCLSVLTPRFDHIIIDSPPILAVTDAAIIGQMVGGTLMVLKSGEHPMREIEQAAKRLQQADVNLRGIVFNDVDMKSQRYGAGRYSYQYSYKNGKPA